jgi:hypothetical protein
MVVFIKRNQITVVSVHFYKQFIVYQTPAHLSRVFTFIEAITCPQPRLIIAKPAKEFHSFVLKSRRF